MSFYNRLISQSERTNIIIRNVAFSSIIRGISILISLILVPLALNYVSAELYGIWLSLSSIVTWLGFFDVGLGLGMRNRLTTAIAYRKYKYGRVLVSTTYAFIFIIFSVVGFLSYIGCQYVDWPYWLNISPKYNEVVTLSFQIVLIAFCLRVVLLLISNVCEAFQNTALSSLIGMLSQIASLLFLLFLVKVFVPNLIFLSMALCLAPLLTYLFANILLFKSKFSIVSPSFKYIRKFVIKDVVQLGGQFFILQVIVIVLYQSTNFIISHYCGPEQVTVYNVSYKYLNVALLLFTILQSPVWSAFNDAYAKKDFAWMKSIYRKLLFLCVISEFLLFLFVMISPFIYRYWIGNVVYIPFHITVLMGIYIGLNMLNSIYAAIVNGLGKLKLETICACAQPFIYFPLIILFASRFKLEGIIMSLIAVNLPQIFFIVKQVNLVLSQKDTGIYSK